MEDSSIQNIKARQIFDSRGYPTVEVDVQTSLGIFRAAVPSGASTGKYEALELRDNNKQQYLGKGVSKAVNNVNDIIRPKLIGRNAIQQRQIDKFMVEQLDGSKNQYGWSKQILGANAILAVSLATARAGAAHKKLKLYQYLRYLANGNQAIEDINLSTVNYILPCPAFNLINGGKHGGNDLAMQQFMILPTGATSFSHAMKIGVQVYHHLKKLLEKKYGLIATNVGDEGGFSPPAIKNGNEALQILIQALNMSGHSSLVEIGMDCAASQFYNQKQGKYDLLFKNKELSKSEKMLATKELCDLYCEYTQKYPIISIQDAFDQDDSEGWSLITSKLGDKIQIVGDDLLVTNKSRIQNSIKNRHCNALLLKVNQIGSLTQAIEASLLSREYNWGTMVSHRSGQTQDTFIADLVVGLGTGQIKTGAPCRSQRLAKYNQILRIQEELGQRAIFAGKHFKFPYNLLQNALDKK